MNPRPERIAAVARALGAELGHRVRLYSDALADALARELRLAAWDREQLIGQVQTRLQGLREQRFREYGGSPVRVVERRDQPLESFEDAWRHLRQGRRVRLEHEPGACSAVVGLMRGMARAVEHTVQARVLEVAAKPWSDPPRRPSASSSAHRRVTVDEDDFEQWPVVGVYPPGPRVAVIEASADRELSAFVLARASLRRMGAYPRAVKFAYVVGTLDRLQHHLRRLWVGAEFGPATAPGSFAGPVDAKTAERFLAAHAAWSDHEGVATWCGGGRLERTDDDGVYLAPALFRVEWPAPDLPTAGPMLVVVRCTPEQSLAGAEAAVRQSGQLIIVGGKPGAYPGDAQYIRGALLTERLPTGLPEPRPV